MSKKLDRNKIEFVAGFAIDNQTAEDSRLSPEELVKRNRANYLMGIGAEIEKVKGDSMWSSQEDEKQTLHSARLFIFTADELKAYRDKIREDI